MLRKELIFGFILIFILILAAAPGVARPGLKIGSPAPELTLPDLQGRPVNLSCHQGKKNVILTFWTTWSKPCAEELKFLQGLYDKYRKRGLEVIAVSFDKKITTVQPFVSRNKLVYTILIDKKYKYLDDYRILIIPTIFVIDKNGILRHIFVDFDENIKKVLEKEVVALLGSK